MYIIYILNDKYIDHTKWGYQYLILNNKNKYRHIMISSF